MSLETNSQAMGLDIEYLYPQKYGGTMMTLRVMEFELIDSTSRTLNRIIERQYKDFEKIHQQGTRMMLERNADMRAQVEKEGMTINEFVERENDMPLSEGHSGMRNFLAQAGKGEIDKCIRNNDLTELRRDLTPWFLDGKYRPLPKREKSIVMALATRPMIPTRLYHEQEGWLDVTTGDVHHLPEPESWSPFDKAVMGETCLTLVARHGTAVSLLSRFPGEEEFISYNPNGYKVVSVEDRIWMGKRSRRVVTLEEL